jgi:hypothetical protein
VDVGEGNFRRTTVMVPWSGCQERGLGAAVQTVGLTGGPGRVLIFSDFPKLGQTCKFEIDAFVFSKKSQILHETRMEYCAQLYQFWLPQIPNVKNVKNPGTDSIFKSSMNFKGDQTFWEKIDKFSKILSGLDIQKNEFS